MARERARRRSVMLCDDDARRQVKVILYTYTEAETEHIGRRRRGGGGGKSVRARRRLARPETPPPPHSCAGTTQRASYQDAIKR